MEAEQLKQVDIDYRLHQLAYLGLVVKAEKKVGKYKTRPVYTTFKKFFDYEKAIKRAKNPKKKGGDRLAGIGRFLSKQKE